MVLFFYGLNIPTRAVLDLAAIASKASLTKFQVRVFEKKSVRFASGVITMNSVSFLEKL